MKILGFIDPAPQRSLLEEGFQHQQYSNAGNQFNRTRDESTESLERRNAELERKLHIKEQEVEQVSCTARSECVVVRLSVGAGKK